MTFLSIVLGVVHTTVHRVISYGKITFLSIVLGVVYHVLSCISLCASCLLVASSSYLAEGIEMIFYLYQHIILQHYQKNDDSDEIIGYRFTVGLIRY